MPSLSSTAASTTEPTVGALECASGSQMCSGHSGVFTARPSATSTAAVTAGGAGRAVGRGDLHDVEGAGLGPDEHEADQHQRRPEHGEDQEPGGRAAPAGLVVRGRPSR